MTNEQQCHLKEKLISELLEEVESIKTSLKNMFFTPQQKCKNICDFRLGAFLSLLVNLAYRVLLLQGGQIYCPTLLIPEMGNGTFFKGGCTWSFKK
jgi:hypothetical protein